jgi:hypothetical protein
VSTQLSSVVLGNVLINEETASNCSFVLRRIEAPTEFYFKS